MSASGASLSTALIGSENIETALRFYRDFIGLDVAEGFDLEGPGFEMHWQLPAGTKAEAVLLRAEDCVYGQVLLLDFKDAAAQRIRQNGERSFVGLFNLNFYVEDVIAVAQDLKERGFDLWSQPVLPETPSDQGQVVEVLFEGPDGAVINLVQLVGGDETTVIGKLRSDVQAHGLTRTGFTPVATSSHIVTDAEPAIEFYRDILGMTAIMDVVMSGAETNEVLQRPDDASTRFTLMNGNHMFGKAAVSNPVNYEVPSLVKKATPPSIGYFAQSFVVSDLNQTIDKAVEIGVPVFSAPTEVKVPGLGNRQAVVMRCPGSGALIEIVAA